jgi:hypothetical protein
VPPRIYKSGQILLEFERIDEGIELYVYKGTIDNFKPLKSSGEIKAKLGTTYRLEISDDSMTRDNEKLKEDDLAGIIIIANPETDSFQTTFSFSYKVEGEEHHLLDTVSMFLSREYYLYVLERDDVEYRKFLVRAFLVCCGIVVLYLLLSGSIQCCTWCCTRHRDK